MTQQALTGAGYDPRHTPIDTLMQAPLGTALAVAEEMEEYDDDEGTGLEGFQTEELPLEHWGYTVPGFSISELP